MEEFEITIELKDQEIINGSLALDTFKDAVNSIIADHDNINSKYVMIWDYLLHISIKDINRKKVTLTLKTERLNSIHEKLIKQLSNNIYILAKAFNKLQIERSN